MAVLCISSCWTNACIMDLSSGLQGPSATIKSHHNVGGLPAHMKLQLIEPLRELFKDEVSEERASEGGDGWSWSQHDFTPPLASIPMIVLYVDLPAAVACLLTNPTVV